MTTLEQMRERIQSDIEDGQAYDSYTIGRSRLDWVEGRAEWLLTLPDGTTEWESGGCGDSVNMIDDEDIREYYNEALAEEYADREQRLEQMAKALDTNVEWLEGALYDNAGDLGGGDIVDADIETIAEQLYRMNFTHKVGKKYIRCHADEIETMLEGIE